MRKIDKYKIEVISIFLILTAFTPFYILKYQKIYQNPNIRKELSVEGIFLD